jgi:hypothetical protein
MAPSVPLERMSAGHKNALGFEVNGTAGSILFDLEHLNELQVYFAEDGRASGFRTVLATNGAHHEYVGHWWPPHVSSAGNTDRTSIRGLFFQSIANGKMLRPVSRTAGACKPWKRRHAEALGFAVET